MRQFQLRVKGHPYAIGIESDRMTVEGFGLAYQVVKAEGEHYSVAIDGILYEVELRMGEDGRQVAVVDGVEYPVETTGLVRGRAAARQVARPAPTAGAVEGALTAMMPSKVIAVHVQAGDAVSAGQVVLLLEAMKMESELKAPKDGTVRAVNCKQGDSVEPGVALVVIE